MGRLIDSKYLKEDMKRYGWEHVDSTITEYVDGLDTVEAIPKDQYEARLNADMVAMLKDLRLEIEKIFDNRPLPCSHYQRTLFYGEVDDLILDKINALEG